MKLISKSSEGLHGELKIPGDKSISHRALICASISDGTSKISNLQESEDVINTLKSLRELGVSIVKENESYYVEGKGFRGLKESENQLYFGNSGTGIRLMSGILSIQNFSSSLVGDESLSRRPMKRIIEPLIKMGVNISGSKEDTFKGRVSSLEPDMFTPIFTKGSIILFIGLLERDSSPVRFEEKFWIDSSPDISLIPVPEFPK